jgi:hypothetical protein
LRLEVVFGQRHRERERDPAAEPVGGAGQPAVHRRAGQRAPRPVQPGDPEQPQERAFLTERGRRACARTPRAGKGLRALGELVDGLVSH